MLFSRNTPLKDCARPSQLLGIATSEEIGKYIGFRLNQDACCNLMQREIISKVRSKLAGWKSKTLTAAGRFTLAKSIISSIPIYYYMQIMKLSLGVHKELDKLGRQCICGGREQKRGMHMIRWEKICQNKREWGTG